MIALVTVAVVVAVAVTGAVVAAVPEVVVAVVEGTAAPNHQCFLEAAPPPLSRVGGLGAPACRLGTTVSKGYQRGTGRASLNPEGGGEAGWEETRWTAPLGAPGGGRDVQSWPRNLQQGDCE